MAGERTQGMTIHDTVIVRPLMRWLALFFFMCTGWKVEGHKPPVSRYVVIAAPHTSNWDFIYTLCVTLIFKISPQIMIEIRIFYRPISGRNPAQESLVLVQPELKPPC